MPKWKERKTGGSWPDEKSEPICSDAQQKQLITAFNNFISSNCLDCFPGLEQKIRDKWESVEISCDEDVCKAGGGSWPNQSDSDLNGQTSSSGNSIIICPSSFSSSDQRLDAVLLHELVHAVGGKELDCEAVEWNCFSGVGANIGGTDDWDKFKSETSAYEGNDNERMANWAIWNSDTGEVWGIVKEGGSWPSGDTKSKGNLCFQHNDWIHTYPSSGGGWP